MKKSILIDGKPFFYDAEDLSYETTTAMSHEAGVKLLALTKKLFDAKNMKFYLAFGTLLGAIREHDIIKGDEDLDIFVKNEDAFKQIIPYFDEKGLHLIRVIPGDTYSFRSDANSYIDIYILHKIHKFNIWRFYCYSLASMYTPKKYVKDFQNIDFLGMTFECPRNPEKLVEFWYGKTWRTPIRGHKFYYEVKSRYYWKNFKKIVKKYWVYSMFRVFKKNAVFKNSAIYMGTDAFSRAIAFLLLPIISKYLVPEQLGIAANFDVLQSILALLAGQAVVNSIPYFFYKMDKNEMAALITNLIYLIIILNVFFSCVILFSSGIIEQYLKIKLWLQVLTVVSVISMLITEIDKLVFRLEDKPYKFAILQLLQSFLYIGLQVVMVIFLEMQALGRIYSTVLSVGIVCVLHICILYKKGYIVLKYDRQSIEKLLKFGLPLLPHSISFWLKSGLDKVLLTTYCGLAVNGLYSMAMTFGAIYTMCEQSFSRAYTPYLQKRLSFINEQTEFVEKRKIVKMTYGFGVMFLLLLFLLIPSCWLVINNLVDEKYIPCFTFIPFVLIARTIHAYYSLIVEYIYTAQKTLGLGIITFSGSACQLLLTFLFVKGLGASGINFSLILGEVLIMLSVWYYSNKVYPMPWFSFFRKK